ncbi:hypothetical protein M422DRAFT_273805 [Sphaerobolus stellatus SS14]|uniref:Uncharacterized protein n=1 Tax=Sphaerobolus stellatus (strain SS14) TaxID=990650 RepID=A0A0C9U872_SPHS4|nr:hypothetical protein M422DRAFT_273805 [Sphaerobolus stellatus SS14]
MSKYQACRSLVTNKPHKEIKINNSITGVLVTWLFFNLKHVALRSRNNPLSLNAMRNKGTSPSTLRENGLVRNEHKPEESSAGKFGTTTLRTMVDLDLSHLGVDLQGTEVDSVPSLPEEETEKYGVFSFYEMRDI